MSIAFYRLFNKSFSDVFILDSLSKEKTKMQNRTDSLLVNSDKATFYIDDHLRTGDTVFVILIILGVFSIIFLVIGGTGLRNWKYGSQIYQDAVLMKSAGVSDDEIKAYLEHYKKQPKKPKRKPDI